jgi:tRNA-dihydrouridine synthase B
MIKFPELQGKIILAPMADITNIAFRIMCKKYGAGLVSTELLSANAISRENNAVLKLALTDKSEKPVSCQIFSQNTENLVKSAKILENRGFDIIDINFGCPSKKIIEQGSGGALLKRKNKIAEIVKEVSSAINIPLTVKIRSGFKNKINAVEIAKICEENGASAIIIHARTVEQEYSGKADWKVIADVKKAIKIPVIGNGDVFSGEDAERMFKETNCDYIMVGRGTIGNPFIFHQINQYLKNHEMIFQTKEEKIKDYFEYIELAKKFNIFSIKDAKLKAQEFTKGLEGSARLRRELNNVKEREEIESLMKGMMKSVK